MRRWSAATWKKRRGHVTSDMSQTGVKGRQVSMMLIISDTESLSGSIAERPEGVQTFRSVGPELFRCELTRITQRRL